MVLVCPHLFTHAILSCHESHQEAPPSVLRTEDPAIAEEHEVSLGTKKFRITAGQGPRQ